MQMQVCAYLCIAQTYTCTHSGAYLMKKEAAAEVEGEEEEEVELLVMGTGTPA